MTKRNPCTYVIETFDSLGQYLVKQSSIIFGVFITEFLSFAFVIRIFLIVLRIVANELLINLPSILRPSQIYWPYSKRHFVSLINSINLSILGCIPVAEPLMASAIFCLFISTFFPFNKSIKYFICNSSETPLLVNIELIPLNVGFSLITSKNCWWDIAIGIGNVFSNFKPLKSSIAYL